MPAGAGVQMLCAVLLLPDSAGALVPLGCKEGPQSCWVGQKGRQPTDGDGIGVESTGWAGKLLGCCNRSTRQSKTF